MLTATLQFAIPPASESLRNAEHMLFTHSMWHFEVVTRKDQQQLLVAGSNCAKRKRAKTLALITAQILTPSVAKSIFADDSHMITFSENVRLIWERASAVERERSHAEIVSSCSTFQFAQTPPPPPVVRRREYVNHNAMLQLAKIPANPPLQQCRRYVNHHARLCIGPTAPCWHKGIC